MPLEECCSVIGELERLKIVAGHYLNLFGSQSPSTEKPEERLLDMQQVAHRLQIPMTRARELSRRKDGFPVYHLGKYVRVKESDLWRWVEGLQGKGLERKFDHRYRSANEMALTKKTPNTKELILRKSPRD